MTKDIIEEFYNLYQDRGNSPQGFIDYFKARTFLLSALSRQQEEFVDKLKDAWEADLSEPSGKTLRERVEDLISSLETNKETK